jgi:hypothetical protein
MGSTRSRHYGRWSVGVGTLPISPGARFCSFSQCRRSVTTSSNGHHQQGPKDRRCIFGLNAGRPHVPCSIWRSSPSCRMETGMHTRWSHGGEWHFLTLAQFSPSYPGHGDQLLNAQMHQLQSEFDLGRSGDGPDRDPDLQFRTIRCKLQAQITLLDSSYF